MTDLINLAISSLLLILPAYIANSTPVIFRGRHPVDFGRALWDGRRILGDGKTLEGVGIGLFFGTLSGVVLGHPLLALLLSAGALTGDMVGAFIKRRLGIARGGAAPVLDQLDFVFGALLFVSPLYLVTLEQLIFIVIVTPPIHLFTNLLAYLFKLKPHPW